MKNTNNIMRPRRSWSDKEDLVFRELAERYQPKNWAQIAKRMSKEYGFKRRSGKQCRERWHNHLVPGISKKGWSKAEEERLLILHTRLGNKWTLIAEQLPGRTDNAIKNYFYSTVRRSLRRMGKLIGSRDSTSLLRTIKPSTLTKIFSVDEQSSPSLSPQIRELHRECCLLRDEIIQFSSFKPKRQDSVSQQERARYEKVFDKIVKLNSFYEQAKIEEKNNRTPQQKFWDEYKQMMRHDSEEAEEDSPEEDRQDQFSMLEQHSQSQPEVPFQEDPYSGQENDLPKSDSSHKQLQLALPSLNSLPRRYSEQDEPKFQNPQFFIELKDEPFELRNELRMTPFGNRSANSPSSYFGTPQCRFNFFMSPMPARTQPVTNLLSAVAHTWQDEDPHQEQDRKSAPDFNPL